MEEAGILPCLPRKSPAFLALRAASFLALRAASFLALRAASFLALRAAPFLALRAAPFLALHMPAPRGRRMNPSMGLGWGILPQTLPRGAGMCRALVRAYRE